MKLKVKKEKLKVQNSMNFDVGASLVSAHGITLISLVVTIIILIILAGVAINLSIGKNGIFTKAQETKKAQIIAEAKEKIGTEILAAQVEAIERNEELEQAQIADIISNYGELQEDGDTIILKDSEYEVSLLDIYSGTSTTTGSYTELKAKVTLLEQQLEDATKSQSESSKELSELKTTLSQVTVTSDKILKDYTAYSNGQLITGTIENKGAQSDWNPSSSESKIYEAGYYPSNWTVNTSSAYTAGYNAGQENAKPQPLKFSAGTWILGSNSAIKISSLDIINLNQMYDYKKCKVTFGGNMGTYISARIYVDDTLVTTISDVNEHTINLNNNGTFKINLYCYNNLSNGGAYITNIEFE